MATLSLLVCLVLLVSIANCVPVSPTSDGTVEISKPTIVATIVQSFPTEFETTSDESDPTLSSFATIIVRSHPTLLQTISETDAVDMAKAFMTTVVRSHPTEFETKSDSDAAEIVKSEMIIIVRSHPTLFDTISDTNDDILKSELTTIVRSHPTLFETTSDTTDDILKSVMTIIVRSHPTLFETTSDPSDDILKSVVTTIVRSHPTLFETTSDTVASNNIGKPEGLRAVATNATAIHVYFEAPKSRGPAITDYGILLSSLSGRPRVEMIEDVGGQSVFHVILTDLRPFSQYTVRVYAHSLKPTSEYGEPSLATTKTFPAVGAKPRHLHLVALSGTAIQISFTKPLETHGVIGGYHYKITSAATGFSEDKYVHDVAANSVITIVHGGLQPSTQYTVSVSTYNHPLRIGTNRGGGYGEPATDMVQTRA